MADKNPFWLEDLHSHKPLWVNLINNILFSNVIIQQLMKLSSYCTKKKIC